MTSTLANRQPCNVGSLRGLIVDIDITSYPTNGESVTPAILGLEGSQVPTILVIGTEGLDAHLVHDRANNKLKAVVSSTGAEVANTTDIGTFRLLVLQA